MTNEKEIMPQKRTGEILRETATSIASGLSGALASDRKDLTLSAGRVFQGFVKGRGIAQLQKEWNNLKEKGEIKDDYEETSQHRDCLLELLNFLDDDCPDEVRFQTLKKIFLVAATEKTSDRESLLPYEYMKLCRSMSSGEIITMITAYRLCAERKEIISKDPNFDHNWVASIVSNAGFEHRELVEIYKKGLLEKSILIQSQFPKVLASGTSNGLTSLGISLCSYIESYG